MYLRRIELNGFKSFGKKTVLQFTSPVSVIVGPNGSGKSNIAEAMRFVLGEQSVKSMRGKKGEDLIFNGSVGVPRSGRASVSIVFDNSKRQFNIDYDEVMIERVVHRDGVNQYFINKSQVRLKDVIELLASIHIGASSHHIISQGEADRILNASVKDRRSMIEDALGLKIYQYKKVESERKLDKTSENIKEIELLRKEIAPHLKFLSKQVDRVRQAEVMKSELKSLYLEYFAVEETYLLSAKDKLGLEIGEPLKQLEEIEERIAVSKKKIDDMDLDSGKLHKLVEAEKGLQSMRGEKSELSRRLGRLEGMIEYQKQITERGGQENKSKKLIDFSLVEDLSKNIDSHTKEALESSDLNFIKNIFERIKRDIGDFIERYGREVTSSLHLRSASDLGKMQEEKMSIEESLKIAEEKESKLNDLYTEAKKEIEKEKDDLRDVERSMFEMISRQSEIRSRINLLRAKEESFLLEEEEFKRDLTEASIVVGRDVINYQKNTDAFESREVQKEKKRKIERLKIKIEDYGGSGSGADVVKEYEDVVERDRFLEKELDDLNKTADSLKDLIKDLASKLDLEFKEGVKKINIQFQEFFSLLFGGGTASLAVVAEKKKRRPDTDLNIEDIEILEQAEDDVEEGIDININIPNKKLKGLMMMSGGERALTSISLLFAVSQVNPPPFMMLDETDAALDEANSKKYGDMVEALSRYSQLIVITHKRETMARAGLLYGITMGSDAISKILSIKFNEAEAMVG